MIRKIRPHSKWFLLQNRLWLNGTYNNSISTFHTIYILLDIYQLFFSSMPKWSWFEGREIEWRKEFNGHSLCQQRFAFVGCRGKAKQPHQSFHVFGELRFILRFSALVWSMLLLLPTWGLCESIFVLSSYGRCICTYILYNCIERFSYSWQKVLENITK